MKNNKFLPSLGILCAVFLTNCEEPTADNRLQNCNENVTSLFVNDDDDTMPSFLDEQVITVCARSEEELQVLLDNIAAENERLDSLFNTPIDVPPVDEIPVVEPVDVAVPPGQPAAPADGFTISFDEATDFSFGEDTSNAETFSNNESVITAEVISEGENAIKVDFTPSNVINEDGTDAGFFFGGTILDISELGFPEVDFSGTDKSITVNVFSTVPLGFRIQVSDAEGEGDDRANVASPTPGFKDGAHTGSGWEQITIDFSNGVNTIFGADSIGISGGQSIAEPLEGVYNRLQFQFEQLPREVLSTIFIDNVNYPDVAGDVVIEEPVEPVAPVAGSVIEFDQVGVNFEDENSAFSFSNGESTIAVSVASDNLPTNGNRTGSGAAVRVDYTPSNVINEDGSDAGFFFGGNGFDITDFGFDEIDFTGTNRSITINVWSDVAFRLRVQVSDTEGEQGNRSNVASPTPGFKDGQHNGTGWEEITIDFTSGANTIFGIGDMNQGMPEPNPIDGEYSRIQFQYEGVPAGVLSTIYVDNIRYN